MLKVKSVLLILIGFCSIQFAVRDAGSCSVPVFRYALERWKPDPYKGIFIYRDTLTPEHEALYRRLEEATLNPEYPLNLRIRKVDAADFPEKKLQELLQGPVPETLPVLAIWYPEQMGKKEPLWMLDLTQSVFKTLVESPKRKELAESLINGSSIVWIFVPSGNARKDEKARTFIREQLDTALNRIAKMPYFILTGSKEKKLTYALPILTVSRSDPGERFFLDMLLRSESDLLEYESEPMVFPIFGRGRMLGCLFGEYITEKNIQGAVSYLAGACSCEVKALNPGTDLLLSALWDRVVLGDLFVEDDTPLPELTGVMPESPISRKEPARPPEKKKNDSYLFTIYGITLGTLIVAVVFAGLILNHRRKDNK